MLILTFFPFICNRLYFRNCVPGQGCKLHSWCRISSPVQSSPPCAAFWTMVLFEVWFPTSHVLEHSDHSCHWDHVQLTMMKIDNKTTYPLYENIVTRFQIFRPLGLVYLPAHFWVLHTSVLSDFPLHSAPP